MLVAAEALARVSNKLPWFANCIVLEPSLFPLGDSDIRQNNLLLDFIKKIENNRALPFLFTLLRILLICIKALEGNNDFSFLISDGIISAEVVSPWQENLSLVLEGSGCSQKLTELDVGSSHPTPR